MIGVIHIVERDSHNIVNIDFHDQSRHSAHHFDDYTKFSLAALGPQGAIYASNSTSSGNVLSFRPFETWNSSGGDWNIDLPASESVTALAIGGGSSPGIPAEDDLLDGERLDEIAGSGTVVAATSRGFLRFFGASGTQKYIMNFGEHIVAMSASAEWLLIIHRPHDLIKPGESEDDEMCIKSRCDTVRQATKSSAILSWISTRSKRYKRVQYRFRRAAH